MGNSHVDLPELKWTAWQPLENSWKGSGLPAEPGLYRIRRVGQETLDYAGQTSGPLRKRLSHLKPAFEELMPFRDPHTAGPGVWALRHMGHGLEVSVARVLGDDPFRLGREAVVITQHRHAFGRSPTLNFGRMPAGYAMSTERKRLVRGEPCRDAQSCHLPGVPVHGELNAWGTERWCGHDWSPWMALADAAGAVPVKTLGLYVIRSAGSGQVIYIGQGQVWARIKAHADKKASVFQGQLFRNVGTEVAWVSLPGRHSHQLQELENDLISAYVLSTGHVPSAQFQGRRPA